MPGAGTEEDRQAGDAAGQGHTPRRVLHRDPARHRAGEPVGPRERERAAVLGEVRAEGISALARVLRRAAAGDETAAGIRAAALVRSLPEMSMLDSYDILSRAHVRGARLAGDLDPAERVTLVRTATRMRRLRRLDPTARAS